MKSMNTIEKAILFTEFARRCEQEIINLVGRIAAQLSTGRVVAESIAYDASVKGEEAERHRWHERMKSAKRVANCKRMARQRIEDRMKCGLTYHMEVEI
jgi:hypothetical protein